MARRLRLMLLLINMNVILEVYLNAYYFGVVTGYFSGELR